MLHAIRCLAVFLTMIVAVGCTRTAKEEEQQRQLTAATQTIQKQKEEKADLLEKYAGSLMREVKLNMAVSTLASETKWAKEQLAGAEAQFRQQLAAATQTVEQQKQDMADVRAKYDGVVKREGDLNIAVSKLLKEADWAKKQLAVKEEQLQDALDMLKKIKDAWKAKTGVDWDPIVAVVPLGRLQGVITDVTVANGQVLAEVSLGAADKVEKGLKLLVSDDSGKFMGELVVEKVEQNKSTGRLQGPFVKDVKKGMKAVTGGS